MIFSSKQPLFSRKYLLALVWVLPVAILILSRLSSNSDGRAEFIAPNQIWSQDEKSQVTIYFSQGSGLTTNDSARQALLLHGLALRLDDPQINELLYQNGWRIKPQSSSLYTALTLSSASDINPEALSSLISLLQQPPSIDWTPVIERISAEAYLAAQSGRQRAINGLLSNGEALLANRTYVELVDQPMHLLFQGPTQPTPQEFSSDASINSLLAGKSALSVRSKNAGTVNLWQLPSPQSVPEYLALQLVGQLVSDHMTQFPGARVQQLLTPQAPLLVVETVGDEAFLATQLAEIEPTDTQVHAAVDTLEERWLAALEQRPMAWSEAILLFNLEPDALSSAFESLRADATELIEPLIEQVTQSPDRRARLFTAEKG